MREDGGILARCSLRTVTCWLMQRLIATGLCKVCTRTSSQHQDLPQDLHQDLHSNLPPNLGFCGVCFASLPGTLGHQYELPRLRSEKLPKISLVERRQPNHYKFSLIENRNSSFEPPQHLRIQSNAQPNWAFVERCQDRRVFGKWLLVAW